MKKNSLKNNENITEFIKIGLKLHSEKNLKTLYETLVTEARKEANADGATLYIIDKAAESLVFEIVQNDTLNIQMGGRGDKITWPPVSLKNSDGSQNLKNVSTYCANMEKTINISDAYETESFDFTGTKKFDLSTGYRSQSMLVIPLKNHLDEVIGVLQLINAKNQKTSKTISFSEDEAEIIGAIATQAAVSITNKQLIKQLNNEIKSKERSEKKYKETLGLIPDIVYLLAPNGNFTFVSNAIRELGYEPEDVTGKHFSTLIHSDEIEGVSRTLVLKKFIGKITGTEKEPKLFDERRTGERKTKNLEVRLLVCSKDETIKNNYPLYKTYEAIALGWYEKENEEDLTFMGTLGVMRDVTERKKAEKLLKSQQHQLIQTDKMSSLGIMAAGIAHEVNNPLNIATGDIFLINNDINSIVDFISRLTNIKMPNETKDNIEKLKKDTDIDYIMENIGKKIKRCKTATERVKTVIEGLRKFAHLDTGEIAKVNINHAIQTTLQMISKKLMQKIEIKTEYAYLPEIDCYARWINQVFINIIVNAVEAMEGEGKLSIKTSFDKKCIYIEFSDTGHGIKENKISHIFDPFYTTKPVGSGTGLGLSVSYSILADHGGEIKVKNNHDNGVTFKIKLLRELNEEKR